MPKMRFQSLLVTVPLLSGCITVPNTTLVTVPDKLANGAIWAQTNTPATGELTLSEIIDFIEPQLERTCVPVTGFSVCADDQTHGVAIKMPARAGAIMRSLEDEAKLAVAIKQACRELGSKCDFEHVKRATDSVVRLVHAQK